MAIFLNVSYLDPYQPLSREIRYKTRGKKKGVERRVGVNCEYLRKRGGINERGGGIQGDGTGPLKIGRV